MESIISMRCEIVPGSPYHPAAESPRNASLIALRTLRDSGHYTHVRVGQVDTFGSKDAFNVQFNSMDGTLMIHDFSGRPELARQDVELLLKRRNLRLETDHDDLMCKSYSDSWSYTPEPLEVEI
ncbi:MAG: hypothetical protein AABX96_03200 [Nanoarchaeota archaeon]